MTLVVALEGTDGIVMAADSRATVGDPRGLTAVRDSEKKLFRLSTKTAIVSFGQGNLAAQLITELSPKLTRKHRYVVDVMNTTRELVKARYADWFGETAPKDRPTLGFLLGGLEDGEEGTRAYYLMSNLEFAPQLSTGGIALGGVPQYATYLAHRLYDSNMKVEQLVPLAIHLISETATQDPKVGGPIRVAIIESGKNYREISESRIPQIVKRNETMNRKIREFFAGGG